jgi:hypothetical protein
MLAFYIRLMVLISIFPGNRCSQRLIPNRRALAGVIEFPFMLGLSLSSGACSQVSSQSSAHANHSTKTGRSIQTPAVRFLSCLGHAIYANYASRYMPTSHFETCHCSNLRWKPPYRSISHIYPNSHALEIESEACEEDRGHYCPQCGCLCSCLRYY